MAYLPVAQRPTKKLKLPSNSVFWIEYYTTLAWGDRKALREIAQKSSDVDSTDDYFSISSDFAFKRFVVDWNLDDAQGVKLPITQEYIDQLADQDMDALLTALAPVISPPKADPESKKKTKTGGKTSTPPSSEPTPTSPPN